MSGCPVPAVRMLCERPATCLCVGGRRLLLPPSRGDGRQLLRQQEGAQPPQQLAHAPDPPHPMAQLTPRVACYALSGTTTRVAERSAGRGPTARVPGVAATAVAILATLAAARHGPARARRPPHVPGAECNRRGADASECGWDREAPSRPPPGRAWPGGHPRPRRCQSLPRESVLAVVCIAHNVYTNRFCM